MKKTGSRTAGSRERRAKPSGQSKIQNPKSKILSVRNAYEAAGTGRRLKTWQPGRQGPNVAILSDLGRLRERARDAYRNNSWISRGVNSWVSNEVGCGITFKSAAPGEEFKKRADDLWERQTQYMDADGTYDFNGMLAAIVRTRRVAGEIFIRRRLRDLSSGLPVPLQYQLLEPEFCPHDYNQEFTPGRAIRAGIEFNGIGKRQVYWMYRRHPDDNFGGQFADLNLVAIPAESVIHHYHPIRPGQLRGVPAIVQALVKSKDFDEYDDAELVRKKSRAAYTGTITRPQWTEEEFKFDPMSGESIDKDAAGVPTMNLEAGSFPALLPGEGIELFEGDNTGSGYGEFVRQQLLGVGVGQDVPYEFISGDFSKLNDRTLRVVLAEYHRIVEQDRWQLTIPQVCYPIWADFIDIAVLTGLLDAPGYETQRADYVKVSCHPEGWPYLHALQDAEADIARLRAGLTSRKRVLGEGGEDVREIDQEREEDAARSQQLGLTDDFGGSAQPAAEMQPPKNMGDQPTANV